MSASRETVHCRWRDHVAAAVKAAWPTHARARTALHRLVGSLLLFTFAVGCAEAVVGSLCEKDGVGLVTSAHWTEGAATPGTQPASPSDTESRCYCSTLYGRTSTAGFRPIPDVTTAGSAPMGRADGAPTGPEREPPLRPPAALLS
ncbi:MAG: hypothetical protein ACYC5V_14685 [Gemmatimonadaceae bacterium]